MTREQENRIEEWALTERLCITEGYADGHVHVVFFGYGEARNIREDGSWYADKNDLSVDWSQ